ncbi:MAG: amidohydrolase family protein [Ilumatobacter sp.]|uniref:amidohydrolase family protein n=1 Tax=Ilumatobacter sp. TaxID=1967498 RepID=UPI003C77C5B3
MIPSTPEWLAQVVEAPLDPDREIVDPHHHLWPDGGALPYGVDDLVADTNAGHKVVETVFIECHAAYRPDGPRHLRSLGETEFVASSADLLNERHPDAAPITGIVASVDLTIDDLDDVLDAHRDAAGGRLRGVRDALSRAREPDVHTIAGSNAEGKCEDPAFQRGVARLGERDLTYDTWHYHYQNQEFLQLARAVPDTTMVLDHFGSPVAIGSDAGRLDDIFEIWRDDIAAIASCPNTVAKLGGLAMPDNGFGFHEAECPPTSDEFLDVQRRWYEHAIDCFGPERCMFESNFPVDRFSLSYGVYWNAMKKLASQYTDDEQAAMFAGTARRVYSLA